MRSLYLSLAAGAAALALLAAPSAASAQVRMLPPSPRFNANGATHTVPFPSRVFVPPRIVGSTVQSNWNYWANGGYPNIAAAAAYNAALYNAALANRYAVYSSLYNPYATPYAYNPYLMYSAAYSPYAMYGSYGGYGGYGSGYGSYQSPSMSTSDYGTASTASTNPYLPTGTVQSGRMIDVGVYDNRFEPISITIKAGATVRWTNYDTRAHTVTSDSDLWDSGQLTPGSSHSYTFSKPGTYTYHCANHPRMTGTVIVQ